MAQRTLILPSEILKKDIGEVVEAMFRGVGTPCELIFCFIGIEKSD
jgi:hypothetical protein